MASPSQPLLVSYESSWRGSLWWVVSSKLGATDLVGQELTPASLACLLDLPSGVQSRRALLTCLEETPTPRKCGTWKMLFGGLDAPRELKPYSTPSTCQKQQKGGGVCGTLAWRELGVRSWQVDLGRRRPVGRLSRCVVGHGKSLLLRRRGQISHEYFFSLSFWWMEQYL